MTGLHKDEQRRLDVDLFGHDRLAVKPDRRRQRCPTDVAAAFTPADPGWPPFHARHPNPGISRVIDPAPVVVTRPRPRLVADPIPPAVRPFPMAVAIGPPFNIDAGWTPALPV